MKGNGIKLYKNMASFWVSTPSIKVLTHLRELDKGNRMKLLYKKIAVVKEQNVIFDKN